MSSAREIREVLRTCFTNVASADQSTRNQGVVTLAALIEEEGELQLHRSHPSNTQNRELIVCIRNSMVIAINAATASRCLSVELVEAIRLLTGVEFCDIVVRCALLSAMLRKIIKATTVHSLLQQQQQQSNNTNNNENNTNSNNNNNMMMLISISSSYKQVSVAASEVWGRLLDISGENVVPLMVKSAWTEAVEMLVEGSSADRMSANLLLTQLLIRANTFESSSTTGAGHQMMMASSDAATSNNNNSNNKPPKKMIIIDSSMVDWKPLIALLVHIIWSPMRDQEVEVRRATATTLEFALRLCSSVVSSSSSGSSSGSGSSSSWVIFASLTSVAAALMKEDPPVIVHASLLVQRAVLRAATSRSVVLPPELITPFRDFICRSLKTINTVNALARTVVLESLADIAANDAATFVSNCLPAVEEAAAAVFRNSPRMEDRSQMFLVLGSLAKTLPSLVRVFAVRIIPHIELNLIFTSPHADSIRPNITLSGPPAVKPIFFGSSSTDALGTSSDIVDSSNNNNNNKSNKNKDTNTSSSSPGNNSDNQDNNSNNKNSQQQQQRPEPCYAAVKCLAMLAEADPGAIRPYILPLADALFCNVPNKEFAQDINLISRVFPELRFICFDRILSLLREQLESVGGSNNNNNNIIISAKDRMNALDSLLALDFADFSLLEFLWRDIVPRLTDSDSDVRKSAVVACSRLVFSGCRSVVGEDNNNNSNTTGNNNNNNEHHHHHYHHHSQQQQQQLASSSSSSLTPCSFENGTLKHSGKKHIADVSAIIFRLLDVAVADSDSSIRLLVIESLTPEFDSLLSLQDACRKLVPALNDKFQNRLAALKLMGRLSKRNPAVVAPILRRVMLQCSTELQVFSKSKRQEHAAILLGTLVETAPTLVAPYISALLGGLVNKLEDAFIPDALRTPILDSIAKLTLHVDADTNDNLLERLKITVIPYITHRSARTEARRSAAIRALSSIVRVTGHRVPKDGRTLFEEYPHLFRSLTAALHGGLKDTWTVRHDVLALLGFVGAVDPTRMRNVVLLANSMNPNDDDRLLLKGGAGVGGDGNEKDGGGDNNNKRDKNNKKDNMNINNMMMNQNNNNNGGNNNNKRKNLMKKDREREKERQQQQLLQMMEANYNNNGMANNNNGGDNFMSMMMMMNNSMLMLQLPGADETSITKYVLSQIVHLLHQTSINDETYSEAMNTLAALASMPTNNYNSNGMIMMTNHHQSGGGGGNNSSNALLQPFFSPMTMLVTDFEQFLMNNNSNNNNSSAKNNNNNNASSQSANNNNNIMNFLLSQQITTSNANLYGLFIDILDPMLAAVKDNMSLRPSLRPQMLKNLCVVVSFLKAGARVAADALIDIICCNLDSSDPSAIQQALLLLLELRVLHEELQPHLPRLLPLIVNVASMPQTKYQVLDCFAQLAPQFTNHLHIILVCVLDMITSPSESISIRLKAMRTISCFAAQSSSMMSSMMMMMSGGGGVGGGGGGGVDGGRGGVGGAVGGGRPGLDHPSAGRVGGGDGVGAGVPGSSSSSSSSSSTISEHASSIIHALCRVLVDNIGTIPSYNSNNNMTSAALAGGNNHYYYNQIGGSIAPDHSNNNNRGGSLGSARNNNNDNNNNASTYHSNAGPLSSAALQHHSTAFYSGGSTYSLGGGARSGGANTNANGSMGSGGGSSSNALSEMGGGNNNNNNNNQNSSSQQRGRKRGSSGGSNNNMILQPRGGIVLNASSEQIIKEALLTLIDVAVALGAHLYNKFAVNVASIINKIPGGENQVFLGALAGGGNINNMNDGPNRRYSSTLGGGGNNNNASSSGNNNNNNNAANNNAAILSTSSANNAPPNLRGIAGLASTFEDRIRLRRQRNFDELDKKSHYYGKESYDQQQQQGAGGAGGVGNNNDDLTFDGYRNNSSTSGNKTSTSWTKGTRLREFLKLTERSHPDDWGSWLKKFRMSLLCTSRSSALHCCFDLANAHEPFSRQLFYCAFRSAFDQTQFGGQHPGAASSNNNSDSTTTTQQQQGVMSSASASGGGGAATSSSSSQQHQANTIINHLRAATIRWLTQVLEFGDLEVVQELLNLDEYLGRAGCPPNLRLDNSMLLKRSASCKLYAKALRYAEEAFLSRVLDFESAKLKGTLRPLSAREWDNLLQICEQVIRLSNEMGQRESAQGVLSFLQNNFAALTGKGKHSDRFTLSTEMYANLQWWSESQRACEELVMRQPHQLHGYFGLLRALDEQGNLARVLTQWRSLRSRKFPVREMQKHKIADFGAKASWLLGQWKDLGDSMPAMSEERSKDGTLTFYRATSLLHQRQPDAALQEIRLCRQQLDPVASTLIAESYTRAYSIIVSLQQLSELEEMAFWMKSTQTGTSTSSSPTENNSGNIINNASSSSSTSSSSSIPAAKLLNRLKETWTNRLDNMAQLPQEWQGTITNHSLVLDRKSDLKAWLKFLRVCNDNGRPSTAEHFLSEILEVRDFTEAVRNNNNTNNNSSGNPIFNNNNNINNRSNNTNTNRSANSSSPPKMAVLEAMTHLYNSGKKIIAMDTLHSFITDQILPSIAIPNTQQTQQSMTMMVSHLINTYSTINNNNNLTTATAAATANNSSSNTPHNATKSGGGHSVSSPTGSVSGGGGGAGAFPSSSTVSMSTSSIGVIGNMLFSSLASKQSQYNRSYQVFTALLNANSLLLSSSTPSTTTTATNNNDVNICASLFFAPTTSNESSHNSNNNDSSSFSSSSRMINLVSGPVVFTPAQVQDQKDCASCLSRLAQWRIQQLKRTTAATTTAANNNNAAGKQHGGGRHGGGHHHHGRHHYEGDQLVSSLVTMFEEANHVYTTVMKQQKEQQKESETRDNNNNNTTSSSQQHHHASITTTTTTTATTTIKKIIDELNLALILDPENANIWRQLALFHKSMVNSILSYFQHSSSSSSSSASSMHHYHHPHHSHRPAGAGPSYHQKQDYFLHVAKDHHIISAMRGFVNSVYHSVSHGLRNGYVQDLLGFLSLWFTSSSNSLLNNNNNTNSNDNNNTGGIVPPAFSTNIIDSAVHDLIPSVPIIAWLDVVPQLIARVQTDNQAVRSEVQNVLISIATQHPQSLLFPLLVCLNNTSNMMMNDNNNNDQQQQQQEDDNNNNNDQQQQNGQNASSTSQQQAQAQHHQQQQLFSSPADEAMMARRRSSEEIFDKICEIHGVAGRLMRAEAELVAKELTRTAVLWSQIFLHEVELAHIAWSEQNATVEQVMEYLIPLKYRLDHLAETEAERHFVFEYARYINDALVCMEKCLHVFKDNEMARAWEILTNLYVKLNQEIKATTSLLLHYVSPRLTEIGRVRPLSIAVPGQYRAIGEFPRIASIDPTFKVLSSKARPRKLTMFATDGKRYSFLLKGLEDLRQDERVIQLIGLTNTLLAANPATSKKEFAVTTMAVVPLSDTAGIIQWIENCDTMNKVIHEHRQRDSAKMRREPDALREFADITDQKDDQTADRQLTVMQKCEVFDRSLQQGDGMDLAHFMWVKSPNAEAWLDRRTAYIRSLAVMSMLGYVLGLGDRHPGNLMLHAITNCVVHVDFGDSFEAAILRTQSPERVPFRLTRLLVRALEVCGVDGLFRHSCDSVMRVLRGERDCLLAVLEAFVHDPLVSWRAKREDTNTQQQQEQEQQQQQQEDNDNTATDNDPSPSDQPESPTINNNNNNAADTTAAASKRQHSTSSQASNSMMMTVQEVSSQHSDTIVTTERQPSQQQQTSGTNNNNNNNSLFASTMKNNNNATSYRQSVAASFNAIAKSQRQQQGVAHPSVARAGGVSIHGVGTFNNNNNHHHANNNNTHQQHYGTLLKGQTVKELQQQQQEHFNTRAQEILQRIQDKLVGMEKAANPSMNHLAPVRTKPRNVTEQVKMLIEEATASENLSQMYRGWCPYW